MSKIIPESYPSECAARLRTANARPGQAATAASTQPVGLCRTSSEAGLRREEDKLAARQEWSYAGRFQSFGEVSERFKEHAWKVCVRQNRTEGSNPSLSAIFTKGAIGPLGKDGVTRKTRTREEGSTKLPGAILDSHRLARVAKRRGRGTWMCRAIPPSPPVSQ